MTIQGVYGYKPELPAGGGSEAVGIVDKLGAGVTGLAIGQRVAAAGLLATWAEYFIAPAHKLAVMPDQLLPEMAAQIRGMPTDALLALDRLDAKPGEWIIINAGNGAVGMVIGQVARARGVKVASIVKRAEARRTLNELGISEVFVSTEKGWQARLAKAIGDDRVAGGIEMIGGDQANEMLHFISPHGKLLSFGLMSGEPLRLDAADLIFKEIKVEGFWGAKEVERVTPERRAAVAKELSSLAIAGKLSLPADSVFPLERATAALAAASATGRKGKVMIAASL